MKKDKSNKRRVERLKVVFDCLTDTELAEKIGGYQPNISRCKKTGLSIVSANIIDSLLDIIEKKK